MEIGKSPQPMIKVLMKGCQLWLKTLPRLFFITFVLVIITSLISYYFFGTITDRGFTLVANKTVQNWYIIPIYFIIPLYFLAIMYDQLAGVDKNNPSIKRSIYVATKNLPNIIMVMLVSAVLFMTGMAFFLIPGIILLVILQFYLPIVILDKKNWYSAFSRCTDLVWGNWWRTMTIVILPFIAVILLLLPLHYVAYNFIIHSIATHHLSNVILYQLGIHNLLLCFYLPLIVSIMYVHLKDLKTREDLPDSTFDKALAHVLSVW